MVPRASRTALAGPRHGRLLVRIAAPPVDDAANEALLTFLASVLGCPRRAVRLISGERAREKRVAVDGVTLEAAARTLLGEHQ